MTGTFSKTLGNSLASA